MYIRSRVQRSYGGFVKQGKKKRHMIHHALIRQCNRIFHMQRKDRLPRPRAILPGHIQILAEKQENDNTELRVNKNAHILLAAVMLVLGIKMESRHRQKKAAMQTPPPPTHTHSNPTSVRGRRAVNVMLNGEQAEGWRTRRRLRSVLLCFEACHALTASMLLKL